ncbi:uncharacterized protein KD926_003067 [Aspergillus affinis]|uniref:uncharacterized protein n=1 Tax=Aspergillus affinis TaxID=1070780 RepID=UPI0022FE825A|nr:uncharacterized protein KD926_003067 [Aspergillus affinis]KAI9043717.1 hypothetical protein KD926_003067 [Aspergillus affinis]
MASTVELRVAIYNNEGGVYKHWGLFIDGPTAEQKIDLQVEGSTNRFRFDRKLENALTTDGIVGLIPLCEVPLSSIGAIDQAAAEAPIHNPYTGYNCQDYVVDLLDSLEEMELTNGKDAKCQASKSLVLSKQEGR